MEKDEKRLTAYIATVNNSGKPTKDAVNCETSSNLTL